MSGEGKQRVVLVTGGAGYVGSHTVVSLLRDNYEVVVIDNLVNAIKGKTDKPESLKRVEAITGRKVLFYEADLLTKESISKVFKKHPIECVMHCAALKAVGESCSIPLMYYKNNVEGTINLLEVMKEHNVKKFVFSSSATVYGEPRYLPIDEDHPTGQCANPYGRTKYFIEEIARDVCSSDREWKAMMLRYFNPVGAHSSGTIGEDPQGIPNNLMPFVAQVAVGRLKEVQVFGSDYKTPDGTGQRDYIHVMDLADGHVAALKKLFDPKFNGWRAYNLGTGRGYTVLEVIASFQKASGHHIPHQLAPRRPGDVDASYADSSRANDELQWKAHCDLDDMCKDAWLWQSKNPQGFRD